MPKRRRWLSHLVWTEFLAPWIFPINLDGTREWKWWNPRGFLLLVCSPVAVLWALGPNNDATWWARILTALAGVVGAAVLVLAFIGYRRLAAPPAATNDSDPHSPSERDRLFSGPQ
ncbi:phage holin family protein [Streptomyces halobius]|uniref:Phage holin family protein n=1 Tax=Streptomyces halobius TaxID=2879846 RepID=A0ABY4MM18_9ACTN|nr:phage holin family protein [Streptomyces halobius]UQA97466.1 phage holin family protein [Streptomyces halobius]